MPDLLSFLNPLTLLNSFALLDDQGDVAYAALALLAAGFIYYAYIYTRYRNQDKRHSHENETRALIENVQATDQLRKHLKGLHESSMVGHNDTKIEGALNNGESGLIDTAKAVGKFVDIDIK